MLDQFALNVVNQLKDVKTVDQAKQIACEILDGGDFQGNIPQLKQAVQQKTSIDQITMLMWNTASSGLNVKMRMK